MIEILKSCGIQIAFTERNKLSLSWQCKTEGCEYDLQGVDFFETRVVGFCYVEDDYNRWIVLCPRCHRYSWIHTRLEDKEMPDLLKSIGLWDKPIQVIEV